MKRHTLKKTTFLTIFALLFAFGCADTAPEEGELLEPEFGKQDSLRAVQDQGSLLFDTPATGVFDEDFQFFGYQVSALPGSEISVEVTQRGSSRGLDTTLIVYGANSTFNPSWERIAFDRNSGWGTLSRLRGLTLPEYETYLVVVSTSDAMGRGNFRLLLTCDGDTCVDDNRPDFSGCDDIIFDLVDTCVSDLVQPGDPRHDEDPEYAIEFCVHDEGALDIYDWSCDGSSSHTPDFCQATHEEVVVGAQACEGKVAEKWGIFDAVPLQGLSMSPNVVRSVESWVNAMVRYGWRDVEAYQIPEGTTTPVVAATIRTRHEQRHRLYIGDIWTRAEYLRQDFAPYLLEAIEADYGQNYSAVEVIGDYYIAAGAQEFLTMHVIHYPEQNVVFVVTEVLAEE